MITRTRSRRLSGLLLLFLILLLALAIWSAVDDIYRQLYQVQMKLILYKGVTG